MKEIPQNVSESTKRRNPHLYQDPTVVDLHGKWSFKVGEAPKPRRIRQARKSLLNKLEQEWFAVMSLRFPNYPRPRPQAVTFSLANGVRYTPDFFVTRWPSCAEAKPTAWEVKGKKAWDDAIVKIKVAAHEWPDIQWILVWKENGQWREQEVLP